MRGPGGQVPPWSTAEAEKERLYEQAQAAAIRTQGLAASNSPQTNGGSPPPQVSAGAALYQQAMSAVSRETSARAQNNSPPQNPVPRAPIPQYPTVESEKTALKRYYEAKAAASRSQGQDYTSSEPISYDALYPVNNSGSSQPPPAPSPPLAPPAMNGHADLPPPAFSASSSQHPILSEKERLRRHYEAQDAATPPPPMQMQMPPPIHTPPPAIAPPPHSLPPPHSPPPPMAPPPIDGATFMSNGVSEKELLRRKYEAEDAAASQGRAPPPTPPTRSYSGLPAIPRSPPMPPIPGSPGRPLTANEEKARLRAQYEAEEARASSAVRPDSALSNHSNGLPTPPPLRPRPPVHYIRETQEEDSRTQSQLFTLDQGEQDFGLPHQYSPKGINGSFPGP
jgi:hypothetical protein